MRVKMGTVVPKMGTFVHLREKLRASGDAIALDTATHFAFREECMACPAVHLCHGSCMFLEGNTIDRQMRGTSCRLKRSSSYV